MLAAEIGQSGAGASCGQHGGASGQDGVQPDRRSVAGGHQRVGDQAADPQRRGNAGREEAPRRWLQGAGLEPRGGCGAHSLADAVAADRGGQGYPADGGGADYRFLAPTLAQAGYRVANADLRGHGESSMGWASITRTDVAGDLLALIDHLGGPAVIIGHSISGGAATIAAATRPDLVAGIVEINPFTRTVHYSLGGLLRVRRYRRCLFLLGGTQLFRSLRLFMRYLNLAYPAKPADYDGYMAALAAKLREPGRMAEFMKTFDSPADAEKQLARLKPCAPISAAT